jgi:hypothetical protein
MKFEYYDRVEWAMPSGHTMYGNVIAVATDHTRVEFIDQTGARRTRWIDNAKLVVSR